MDYCSQKLLTYIVFCNCDKERSRWKSVVYWLYFFKLSAWHTANELGWTGFYFLKFLTCKTLATTPSGSVSSLNHLSFALLCHLFSVITMFSYFFYNAYYLHLNCLLFSIFFLHYVHVCLHNIRSSNQQQNFSWKSNYDRQWWQWCCHITFCFVWNVRRECTGIETRCNCLLRKRDSSLREWTDKSRL